MFKKEGIYNWVIYKITSPSKRIYIGVTSNFKKRVAAYKFCKTRNQTLVHSSIQKYGFSSHKIEVVESFSGTPKVAYDKEMYWVRGYMSNKSKYANQNGLNLTDGGDGAIGYRQTKESIEKRKQYKHTEEAKSKISKASKGNTYRLGHKMTLSQIEHRSSKIRGRKIVGDELRKHIERVQKSCGRGIKQFSVRGEFIREYSMICIATKEIGIPRLGIMRNLSGQCKQSRGFVFKYA